MSLSLHLEQRSGIPLHHQISEQLRQRIGAGSYRVGEKLPAESVLARSLGVSRNTVRQAIAPLVADGLVTGAQATAPAFPRRVPPRSVSGAGAAFPAIWRRKGSP